MCLIDPVSVDGPEWEYRIGWKIFSLGMGGQLLPAFDEIRIETMAALRLPWYVRSSEMEHIPVKTYDCKQGKMCFPEHAGFYVFETASDAEQIESKAFTGAFCTYVVRKVLCRKIIATGLFRTWCVKKTLDPTFHPAFTCRYLTVLEE